MVFFQPQQQPTMAQSIQSLQQAQAQQLQSTSRQQQPDFSEDISPARNRSTRLASVTTRGLQSLASVSSLPVRRPSSSSPLSYNPTPKLADTHTYNLRSSSSPIRTITSSSRAAASSSRSPTNRLPLSTIPDLPPADHAISPLVLDNAALDGQSFCACYACTPDSLVGFFDARYTPPDTALEYSPHAQSGTQSNCLGNSKSASSIPSDSYNNSYAQLIAQNSVDSSSVQSIDNSFGHLPLQQQQHLPLQNYGIGQISQNTSTLGLGLLQTSENSISAYATNSHHNKPASLLDDTFVSQLVGFGNSKRNSRKKTQHNNKNPENPASSVDSSLPQTPAEASAPLALQLSDPVFDIMKYTKNSGEFDFDMLAASFLNDQVVAFDSLASAGTAGTGLSSNSPSTINSHAAFDTSAFLNADFNLFGNDFIQQQQQQQSAKGTTPALPAASSLQNAFRTYAALPRMDSSSSSSSSSSAAASPRSFSVSPSSPNLASPVFDTALAFPYVGSANLGDLAANAWKDGSPAFSTMGTPALVADDTVAPSLMTSPMWGQLDLGSVSLFPQQTQQAEAPAPAPAHPIPVPRRQSSLQNEITLPTISPMELSLSAPQSGATSPVFSEQTRPVLSTSVSAPVAPSSSSAPSSKKRTLESSVGLDDDVPKRARRAGSSVAPSARDSTPASSHNGTRQGSAAPLSLDAPTQARTYYGPESKTSKRAVPAAAARKVAAIKAQAELVDEGELDVEGAIEMSIEAKRRQNTVAARRSRQRKAEHLQGLEDKIAALSERLETLENEKTVWMMRALAAGWTEASRETS